MYCPMRYRVVLCGAFAFCPNESLLTQIDVAKSASHHLSRNEIDDGFRRYENSLQIEQRPRRPLPMVKPTRRSHRRRHALTLPELEHSKAAVLNSLGSLQYGRY